MWGPQRPKFGGFWILDFGDFGDFGFWGFWILDLDFGFCDKFWMLHKKRRLCTPNRVGGFIEDVTLVGRKKFPHSYISSSKGTVSKMLFWCCLGSKSSSSQVQSQTCSPWELWLSCFAWARPVFVYTMGFLRYSVETWLHQMAPWHWAAKLSSLWT